MSAEYVETGFIEGAETGRVEAGFLFRAQALHQVAVVQFDKTHKLNVAKITDIADSVDASKFRHLSIRRTVLYRETRPLRRYVNDMLSDMKAHGIRSHCDAKRWLSCLRWMR